MIALANFGCQAGDMGCLCPETEFYNGITDCAKQSCSDGATTPDEVAAAASNSAVAMCASALSPSFPWCCLSRVQDGN